MLCQKYSVSWLFLLNFIANENTYFVILFPFCSGQLLLAFDLRKSVLKYVKNLASPHKGKMYNFIQRSDFDFKAFCFNTLDVRYLLVYDSPWI